MNLSETRAVLTVALLASHADGAKHARESAELQRIAETLSRDEAVQLPTLVADLEGGRVTLGDALPALQSEQARQLAYEMAVGVCDADGAQSDAEQAFLAALRRELKLDAQTTDSFTRQAQELAQAPLGGAAAAAAPPPKVDDAALERDILNTAILNGALELLPETLSTLAIIPLQMKLVYRIGRAHGYELDSGHAKDFLATAGVGLSSQYLEQAGRKLLTGLLGRVGGGALGGLGRQAVSSGMSFAATMALGQLAKRYYAGGRTLSAQMLKDGYASVVQQAQAMYQQHLPAIQERARSLNVSEVLSKIRG